MQAPRQEAKKYKLCPAGTFPARVIGLVHLGTADWYGKGEDKNNIRVTFELPTKKAVFDEEKGEQPFIISKEMSFSMYKEAGLRKITHACLNTALTDKEADSFDVEKILGKPCLITVEHAVKGDKTYANFEGAAPLVEGMEVPEAENPLVVFWHEEFNQEVFDAMPEFLQDKIKESNEWKLRTAPRSENPQSLNKPEYPENLNPEDIPF